MLPQTPNSVTPATLPKELNKGRAKHVSTVPIERAHGPEPIDELIDGKVWILVKKISSNNDVWNALTLAICVCCECL
jgi:hypothetical protein